MDSTFWKSKAGFLVLRRNSVVTSQCQLQSTSETHSVDRSHDRLRALLHPVEHELSFVADFPCLFNTFAFLEHRNIRARHEASWLSRNENCRLNIGISLELFENTFEFLRDLLS